MGLTARAVGPTLIHDPLGISTLHSSGSAIPVEVLLPISRGLARGTHL